VSIPDHIRTNFDTLLRAASNGNLALMECTDAITGEPRYVICAVGREGTDYLFTPFGHLADGNPYDAYLPPGINREDPNVSPLFATDVAGVAPAFIVTADHDPLHDEGDEYAAKLRSKNVAVDHTCWPGMIHGFASLAGILGAGKRLIDQVGTALRDALA